MDDGEFTGNIRNPNGTFAKGVSGNPAGKPIGSISVIAKIKKKFLENPEYFDEWTDKLLEDPRERRAVMEQIDGKPKQAVEMSGKDGGPLQVNIISFDAYDDSSQSPTP